MLLALVLALTAEKYIHHFDGVQFHQHTTRTPGIPRQARHAQVAAIVVVTQLFWRALPTLLF